MVDPMDTIQNVNVSALFMLVNTLSERVKALEAVLLIKGGSVVISGRDIEIRASGTASIKAAGNVVLKGARILQNQ